MSLIRLLKGSKPVLGGKILPERREVTTPVRRRRTPALASERQVVARAGTLKSFIDAQDGSLEQSRIASDYIHVSSLLNFCPRRLWLALNDNQNVIEVPRSADRVVWAMGRAAEHHVRTQIIHALNFEQAYGRWTCKCEQSIQTGHFPKNITCLTCNGPLDRYIELSLFDHELRIVGNPDLILIIIGGKATIVEIKSINKREFDELKTPKASHVFQGTAYHRLFRGSFELEDAIAIIYVCKDYTFKSPYKEFSVPYQQLDNIVERAFDEVRLFRETQSLPQRLEVCSSMQTSTAKNCALCVNCFSRR